METAYIPGKLQLKNCLGLKRMKRQMDKMCKMKTSNNESKSSNSNVVIHERCKKSERECNGSGSDDKNSKEVELKEDKVCNSNSNINDELNEFTKDMTKAEKMFYMKKLKKLPDKIKKMSKTSFREKYQQYYKSLTKLPEHHDIPKVGPG